MRSCQKAVRRSDWRTITHISIAVHAIRERAKGQFDYKLLQLSGTSAFAFAQSSSVARPGRWRAPHPQELVMKPGPQARAEPRAAPETAPLQTARPGDFQSLQYVQP